MAIVDNSFQGVITQIITVFNLSYLVYVSVVFVGAVFSYIDVVDVSPTNPSTVFISALPPHAALRIDTVRFVPHIFQEKRHDAMCRNIICREVTYNGTVLRVGPQVLGTSVNSLSRLE